MRGAARRRTRLLRSHEARDQLAVARRAGVDYQFALLQLQDATRSSQRRAAAAVRPVALEPALLGNATRLERKAHVHPRAACVGASPHIDLRLRCRQRGAMFEHRAEGLRGARGVCQHLHRAIRGCKGAAGAQRGCQIRLRQLQDLLQGKSDRHERCGAVGILLGDDEGIERRQRALECALDALRHRMADLCIEAAQAHHVERRADRAERITQLVGELAQQRLVLVHQALL